MSDNIVQDKTATLTHDFITGHEYEVVVVAVGPDGTMQALEGAARNTITIQGKLAIPDTPTALTAVGYIESITLTWSNPLNYDFSVMEVWRSTFSNVITAAKIAEVRGVTYTDILGVANATYYYWIRAINTSGKLSDYYPRVVGVSAATLGVSATSIDDFAVTATKMFNKTIILTADAWTNNSPGAGSVAWNAHNVIYNGASYPISAGNTASAYIYWTIGAAAYTGAAAHPTLGTTAFMVAINTAGIHTLVWNSSANMVIGTAFIANLAVTNAKIDLLAVDTAQIALLAVDTAQIALLAVETAQIAALAVTDAKINTLTANKLTAGTIDASVITVTNLNASNITTGTLTGRSVVIDPGGGLGSLKIFSGNSALIIADGVGATVFDVIINGAGDIGDIVMGNYAGDNGCMWDNDAGTFDVRGTLNADDLVAGTLSVDRIAATSIAAAKLATDVIDAGKIIVGLLTATNIQTGTLTGRTVQTAAAGQRIIVDGTNNRIDLVEVAGTNVVLRIDDDFPGVSTNPGMLISSSTGAYLRLSNDPAVGSAAPTQYALLLDSGINVTNAINTGNVANIFSERSGNWASGHGTGIASKYSGTDTDFALFSGAVGADVYFDVLTDGVMHILNTVQITGASGGGVAAHTGVAYQPLTLSGTKIDFNLSGTDRVQITPIGGIAIKLTNKTGSNTVQGQLVRADSANDDAFQLIVADGEECFGIVLEAGVADGSEAWIVVSGIADVAMQDNTAATHGNWLRTSITEAGYANATNASPPGGGIPELDRHMKEIGNCIETVAATGGGTHILARCVLHWN